MRILVVVSSLSLVARPLAAQDTTLARRVQLGASLGAVPDSLRQRGAPTGALVLSVIPGSPAAAAGVQAGDVIVKVGRDTVTSVADALAAIRPLLPDNTVPLAVARRGHLTMVSFRTKERPREASSDFAVEYRAVSARGGKHRLLVAHPNDKNRHPAVLMIGGIGCYSIDGPTGAYRDLANHLTRQGYTTVRVEKLGVGDSEGSCADADFDIELDGYRQALRAMASYPSVDSSRIFLFGHSIGGIEAPLLAGEGNGAPRLRGVAVLSTTGIAWYEYELANLRRQLRLQGLTPDSVERAMRVKAKCGYQFLVAKEARQSILARDSLCAAYIGYPASDAYMQAVADQTPAFVWKSVTAPVLVMWASSDFVTSRAEHLSLVEDINAMHPGAATYVEIPEMDHYLTQEKSMKTSMDDAVSGATRPYFGATLEPVLDRWLDSHKT